MPNGSMSYGVQKVTPVHGTIWKNYKFVETLQNGQEKVKTTSLVHNFSILPNCWNHDQRSKSHSSVSKYWLTIVRKYCDMGCDI